MTVPGKSLRKRSSHATDSASKWFVGSSSSSMSGFDKSRRHSATRRRSPPESDVTLASHGGRRSASAAISSLRSSSQPPAASIASWSLPCSSSSLFISSSSIGSANLSLISLKRLMSFIWSATPSSTIARTFFAGSSAGSCVRKPILMPGCGRASPSNSVSTPAMIFSRRRFARAVHAEHADLGAREEAQARCRAGCNASAERPCRRGSS